MMAYAPSNDSDQPARQRNQTRVFALTVGKQGQADSEDYDLHPRKLN